MFIPSTSTIRNVSSILLTEGCLCLVPKETDDGLEGFFGSRILQKDLLELRLAHLVFRDSASVPSGRDEAFVRESVDILLGGSRVFVRCAFGGLVSSRLHLCAEAIDKRLFLAGRYRGLRGHRWGCGRNGCARSGCTGGGCSRGGRTRGRRIRWGRSRVVVTSACGEHEQAGSDACDN